MKPSNILVSQFGDVKLADFGLAKVFGSPDKRYSPQCVTLWYKPPELLFGATLYGPSVDMWSMGCIFAELLLRRPLLPGSNDLDQLGKIFATFGTPTEQEWPQMKSLPNYIEYEDCPKVPLKSLFVAASDDALDLLSKMLVYDPNKRITATEALEHPYFKNQPRPSLNKDLPLPQKVKKNRDEKIQVQPASTNGKGKILSFDDDLNTTTSDMNLSGYTNATDTSANLSGMVDDSFEAPTPASTAEKRRREPDEHDDMHDDIDGDGERPTVRRKLAL
jgi:serine/threonine protein kinase